MRGLILLVATILTFGYGFAAQAAMTVDRAATLRRLSAPVDTPSPRQTLTASGTVGCWPPSPSRLLPRTSVRPERSTHRPLEFRRAVALRRETYKIEGAYHPVTMDMSLDQAAITPARRFWRTWRRELVRGGVLFGLVVCAGLFIRSIKVRVPSPLGTLGSFGDFNWGDGEGSDLFGHGREVGDAWDYRALIKPTQHVWIRNTNGPIEVVAGAGDSLVVHVEKSWRMSDPQSVQIIPVLTERLCGVGSSRTPLRGRWGLQNQWRQEE